MMERSRKQSRCMEPLPESEIVEEQIHNDDPLRLHNIALHVAWHIEQEVYPGSKNIKGCIRFVEEDLYEALRTSLTTTPTLQTQRYLYPLAEKLQQLDDDLHDKIIECLKGACTTQSLPPKDLLKVEKNRALDGQEKARRKLLRKGQLQQFVRANLSYFVKQLITMPPQSEKLANDFINEMTKQLEKIVLAAICISDGLADRKPTQGELRAMTAKDILKGMPDTKIPISFGQGAISTTLNIASIAETLAEGAEIFARYGDVQRIEKVARTFKQWSVVRRNELVLHTAVSLAERFAWHLEHAKDSSTFIKLLALCCAERLVKNLVNPPRHVERGGAGGQTPAFWDFVRNRFDFNPTGAAAGDDTTVYDEKLWFNCIAIGTASANPKYDAYRPQFVWPENIPNHWTPPGNPLLQDIFLNALIRVGNEAYGYRDSDTVTCGFLHADEEERVQRGFNCRLTDRLGYSARTLMNVIADGYIDRDYEEPSISENNSTTEDVSTTTGTRKVETEFIEVRTSRTGLYPFQTWIVDGFLDGTLVAHAKAGPLDSNNKMMNKFQRQLDNYSDNEGRTRKLDISPADSIRLAKILVLGLDWAKWRK